MRLQRIATCCAKAKALTIDVVNYYSAIFMNDEYALLKQEPLQNVLFIRMYMFG